MEVAINQLIVHYKTKADGSSMDKEAFVREHWEAEKSSLLRVPDAFQAAIYLGLPFSAFEWNGILPSTAAGVIRCIPGTYSPDNYPPSSAIAHIAGYGNDEALAAYLDVFPASHITDADINAAMARAMSHGRVKCVKILEAYTSPMPKDFCSAANFGHIEVVRATIGYMDARIIGLALEGAARYGHMATVAFLLETGVVQAENIEGGYTAARRSGHTDIAEAIGRYRV